MKVLMLGWEFPPHISGGLGTACYGLTRGLAHDDVDVLFVVPHAHGDEDHRYARVRGANEVPVTGPAAEPDQGSDPDAWAELWAAEGLPPLAGPGAGALAEMAAHLRVISVDSPLTPYLTEAQYRDRMRVLESEGGAPGPSSAAAPGEPATDVSDVADVTEEAADEAGADSASSGDPAEPLHRAAGAEPGPRAAETTGEAPPDASGPGGKRLSFSGGYGPDLMSEVARYARVVAEVARTETFDVIHAHDWMTYPAGIVAARASGRPLVVHLHASEYDRSGEDVNSRVRDIEQLGLDAADRVICVSHFLANTARRRYSVAPEKIRVVHNAVTHREEEEAFRVTKAIPEPVVLFLGRVTFQKGPDYFLEAAARVIEVEPHVKFVIGGSGDMLTDLIERAAAMGLSRHVHFTGFLRGRDVERMYALADIYVMPSVSEPFGISPLEAMALDVPVIVSKQSGVSEVITNALKVDFWDVDDIANKILALLHYPALWRQLSQEGGGEARRLRWDLRGHLVHDIYRELAG